MILMPKNCTIETAENQRGYTKCQLWYHTSLSTKCYIRAKFETGLSLYI